MSRIANMTFGQRSRINIPKTSMYGLTQCLHEVDDKENFDQGQIYFNSVIWLVTRTPHSFFDGDSSYLSKTFLWSVDYKGGF